MRWAKDRLTCATYLSSEVREIDSTTRSYRNQFLQPVFTKVQSEPHADSQRDLEEEPIAHSHVHAYCATNVSGKENRTQD